MLRSRSGIEPLFSSMLHFVHNHTIVSIDGALAQGAATSSSRARAGKHWAYVSAGQYDDDLLKVGGRLRFRGRKVTFDYFLHEGENCARTGRVDISDLAG